MVSGCHEPALSGVRKRDVDPSVGEMCANTMLADRPPDCAPVVREGRTENAEEFTVP